MKPVKAVWWNTIEQGHDASTTEQRLNIELMCTGEEPCRTVLRTRDVDAHDSRGWRHFNLYTADAEGSGTDSCVALPKLQCVPIDKTDSLEGYKALNYWMGKCNTNHQCITPEPPLLPKRILKLLPDRVHLYLSEPGERARYATLSHRWGTAGDDLVLTLENLEFLVNDIPWPEIPKTAQDAIEVCRKLGIQYLWIDALNIIQGYKPDWDEESEKMSSIYGHSYLNIAAMDSNDPHGGCFRSTGSDKRYPAHAVPGHPKIRIQQQPHFTHLDFGQNYATSSRSPPLLQRGWVLQERLLSPRCVYYGRDELLWECKACADCLCGGTNVIARFKDVHHRSLSPNGNPLPFEWMRITERYSCLDLTHDSDRAVALSGIAQEAAASGRGGKYLAGLWSEKLAHQLCWEIPGASRKPMVYIAPSWSWLSVFGSVHYGQNRMDFQAAWSKIDVTIIDAAVSASKPDGTGKIESGYLLIEGKILDMAVKAVGDGARPPVKLTHSHPSLEYSNFVPDYRMEPEEFTAMEKVTVLYWGRIVYDETFVVLQRLPEGENTYQRLGIFHAKDAWTREFRGMSKRSTKMRIE